MDRWERYKQLMNQKWKKADSTSWFVGKVQVLLLRWMITGVSDLQANSGRRYS